MPQTPQNSLTKGVENGIHEIYVNAEANDDSLQAELMNYMVDSNGYHTVLKNYHKRYNIFKESQKGVNEIGNVFDEDAEEYYAEHAN